MRSPLLDIEYNKRVLTEVLLYVRQLLKKIKIHVDLGSGDCSLTQLVINTIKPHRTIALDIDDSALELCKKKGFETMKVDLNTEQIPLPDSSVDTCTAFELIEHLWNKDHLLEEAYRILKPGGVLILSTPNLTAWASRILLLFGKPPLHYDVSLNYALHRPTYGHISLYTQDLLVKHLSAVGFKVLRIRGLLMPWYRKNTFVSKLTTFLSKVKPSLAPDLLIVARK